MSGSEGHQIVQPQPFEAISLRHRIREACQHLHDLLDHDVLSETLCRSGCTESDYRAFLIRTYGFIKPIEESLLKQDKCFVPRENLRADAIAADLRTLGMSEREINSLPVMQNLPTMETVGHVMGVSYVIEGSMMGGLVLAKQVSRHLRLPNESMTFFLPSSPRDVVARFQRFVNYLDTFARCSCDEEDAMMAANETFRLIGDWFAANSDRAR